MEIDNKEEQQVILLLESTSIEDVKLGMVLAINHLGREWCFDHFKLSGEIKYNAPPTWVCVIKDKTWCVSLERSFYVYYSFVPAAYLYNEIIDI